MTTLGIDVSKFQQVINWAKVPAWRGPKGERVEFAIAKASEGNGWADPKFELNWPGINGYGLVRGAYHFAHPDDLHDRDAEDEAKRFVDRLRGFRQGVDFAALDIEEARSIAIGPAFVDWVRTFLETVDELLGQYTIVYTGGPFFDQHDGAPSAEAISFLAGHPLWLAAYVTDPARFLPPEWRSVGWTIWQKSGDVAPPGETVLRVDGVPTNVDRDIYRGTIDEMRLWIRSLVIAPPYPEPGPRNPEIAHRLGPIPCVQPQGRPR